MFDQALAYLGLQITRLQFRGETDSIQPLSAFFSGARNVLITLPVGYEEAMLAGNALRNSCKSLDHLQLTVINYSTRATALTDFPRCEVVRIDPADINRFSLPTKQLLHRILVREYDLAMDLNLDFVLHTAYICKASRAKVRVGFAHRASDLFFNVQFNLGKEDLPQARYEKFTSYLRMF